MTPALQSIAHASYPLPNGSFKHTSVLVISHEIVSTTPSPDHNFSAQDRAILRFLYSPFLSALSEAISLQPHDPTASLQKLKAIQTELMNSIR